MSSTQQVVEAIQVTPYRSNTLPLEATASLPISLLENDQVVLAFFWCSFGGPILNRTVSAPYCRTIADPEHLERIRFQTVHPRELGIDVPQVASLGKPTIGGSISSAEMKQVRADFYYATDTMRVLYARMATSPNTFPSENERAKMLAYRNVFHRLAIVVLLPAYHALSPHFFAWLDVVLGPEL